MKKIIFCFGLTCLLIVALPLVLNFSAAEKGIFLYSQTRIDCTKLLDQAENEYNSGNFTMAITLIESCLRDSGVTHDEEVRGYKLLGLAYIGEQLKKEASEAVKKLLLIVPDYNVNKNSDPSELKKIIEKTAPSLYPQLDDISPKSVEQGNGNFTLKVGGSNFVYGSEIRFNGEVQKTIYVSSQELRTEIAAKDITRKGTYEIKVYSPIMGGKLSGAKIFEVTGQTALPWKWIAIGGGAVAAVVVAIITLGGKSGGGGSPETIADPPARP